MKTDSSNSDFQEYARSIDYGNADPRCDPQSPLWDQEFDNETAQVALNDKCYQDLNGNFITYAHAKNIARLENSGCEIVSLSWVLVMLPFLLFACFILMISSLPM